MSAINSDDQGNLVSGIECEGDEVQGDPAPDPDTDRKKGNVVKGLLNLSLLTSNVSQLRTLVFADRNTNIGLWVALLVLIIISLILQLVAGGLLFYLYSVPIFAKIEPLDSAHASDCDYVRQYKQREKKRKELIRKGLIITNVVAILAMVITVLNLIISAIGWK